MTKRFSWRAFISFGLLLSFAMLLVSGVVLYVSPPGRVANWTDWRMFGLSKTGWQNQHTVFGFFFAILSVLHLFFINWKAFLSYLKNKAAKSLGSPRELFGSVFLFLLLVIGTFFLVQPFASIIDFGNNISGSWEKQIKQPPVPHAEKLTLKELAGQPALGGDAEALKAKIEKAGYTVGSLEQTLEDIAAKNRTNAETIYGTLVARDDSGRKLPSEGFGRKTLEQIATERGISVRSLQLALEMKGVQAQPEMTMRVVADKNGIGVDTLRGMLESMIDTR